jgi:UDP-glucose/GDP-mannose dehydrogenase family, NAD binding domain
MYEPGLSDIITEIRQRKDACNLTFSCDTEKAIHDADMIMLCIDTPTKKSGIGSGMALDLGHIQGAVRTIAEIATTDKIVVEKSTVPCGTASTIQDLVHFPDFLSWLRCLLIMKIAHLGIEREMQIRSSFQSRVSFRRHYCDGSIASFSSINWMSTHRIWSTSSRATSKYL